MTKAKRSQVQVAKNSSRAIVITKYDIMGVIHLSQREASQVLRICLSTLKKRFYRLFDERWPSSSKRRDLMDKTPEERLREWNNKKKKVHYLLNKESMDEKFLTPFEFPLPTKVMRDKKRSQSQYSSYDSSRYHTPSPTSARGSPNYPDHYQQDKLYQDKYRYNHHRHAYAVASRQTSYRVGQESNGVMESNLPHHNHRRDVGGISPFDQRPPPKHAALRHSPAQVEMRQSPHGHAHHSPHSVPQATDPKMNSLMPRPLVPTSSSTRYTPYLPAQSFNHQPEGSRRPDQPQH